MTKRRSDWIGRLRLSQVARTVSILGVLLFTLAAGLQPLERSSRISDAHREAISEIADILAMSHEGADSVLSRAGFHPPPPDPATWRTFSELRKVEYAYIAALDASPVEAEKLLAMMSENMARSHEAARHTPALKKYLNQPGVTDSTKITFSRKADLPAPTLDVNTKKAMRAIAEYYESGALGGVQGVLRDHVGLSVDQVDAILHEPGTPKSWLEKGFGLLDESKRDAAIRSVTRELSRRYESVFNTPELRPFLDDAPSRPRPPEHGPLPPNTTGPDLPNTDGKPPNGGSPGPNGSPNAGGGGPAGAGPKTAPRRAPQPSVRGAGTSIASIAETTGRPIVQHAATNATLWTKFITKVHPNAQARVYKTVVRSARGLGGVVFGNSVTAPNLPKAVSIRWAPEKGDPAIGTLFVATSDSEELRLHGVRRDEAWAAAAIVFGDPGESIEPHINGEAIGLVGLVGKDMYLECSTNGRLTQTGVIFHVMVSPAIADTDLGWAAVMCDALPTSETAMEKMARAAYEDDGAVSLVRRVLDTRGSTWKIVDAPAEVVCQGRRLDVRRAESDGRPNASTLLLDINFFRHMDSEPHRSEEFLAAGQVILGSSRDFRQLNDFARVLAVVRWARDCGATWTEKIASATAIPTPAFILSRDDGIGAWTGGNPEADLARRIDAVVTELVANNQPLRDLNASYVVRRPQMLEIDARLDTLQDVINKEHAALNGAIQTLGKTDKNGAESCRDAQSRVADALWLARAGWSRADDASVIARRTELLLHALPESADLVRSADSNATRFLQEVAAKQTKCLDPMCAVREWVKSHSEADGERLDALAAEREQIEREFKALDADKDNQDQNALDALFARDEKAQSELDELLKLRLPDYPTWVNLQSRWLTLDHEGKRWNAEP